MFKKHVVMVLTNMCKAMETRHFGETQDISKVKPRDSRMIFVENFS
jgi:hypothetical protein